MTAKPVDALILFGATGDLSTRMLLPSLYHLHAEGLLSPSLTIVGSARSDLDEGAFRNLARDALARNSSVARDGGKDVDGFLGRLRYQRVDTTRPEDFAPLGKVCASPGGAAIVLSTPPSLFGATVDGLHSAGLTGGPNRLALEKPLGHDLASSREVNDIVARVFDESATFRIDHYLGKETVQNLLALRFGNGLFEPMWNAGGIDHVQITVSEIVGLEGRTAYYDELGALRDMVQNHLLQLVALVAMEPPSQFEATAVRDEKLKVLRSLRPIDRDSAETHTVTGQYDAGAVGGAPVPGYAEELGHASGTETFIAIKAHVDNWRWKGVPFYLRTGKRLPDRHSEIVIRFKPVPHSIFAGRGATLKPNTLLIRLQPEEEVSLLVMAKEPGLDRDGIKLREVPLDVSLTAAFHGARRRIAYERLLLDFLDGDQTLFVRRDEVEAAWAWIDGIRAGWDAAGTAPKRYPAGTWGPSAAIALTERDGVSWHD